MAADEVTHHSVPEIVINRDGPKDRRVAFVDDYGGKIELSTQQLRNLITLLVSDQFWTITGLWQPPSSPSAHSGIGGPLGGQNRPERDAPRLTGPAWSLRSDY